MGKTIDLSDLVYTSGGLVIFLFNGEAVYYIGTHMKRTGLNNIDMAKIHIEISTPNRNPPEKKNVLRK